MTDFHEILGFLEKSVDAIHVSLQPGGIADALREDLCTFIVVYLAEFLE